MKAYRLASPSRLQLSDAPQPTARDLETGEVVLRVWAGGICGTDLPYFAGKRTRVFDHDNQAGAANAPGFPLHEVAGEVIASSSPDLAVGDVAVGWASGYAGLAEYIRIDARGLCPYPPQWPATDAVMLQPLACAVHALDQVGDVVGKRVVVLGQGPIGLLLAHMAKSRGASWVTGVDRVDRTEVALAFGADEFIHSSVDRWAHQLSDSDRPDVVIEAIGHQVGTLVDAIHAVAPYGLVYNFGMPDDPVYPIPMMEFIHKNLTIRAGVVEPRFRRAALERAISHLQVHPELFVDYVTDVFDFADAQDAYVHASQPKPGQHKVVIDFGRRQE